jgi:heme exporter protein D
MKKYLKHYLWAFVAVTVVAVAVLVALTVHGLRNLGADSHSDSVAGARPKSETGASTSTGPGRRRDLRDA